MVCFYGVRWKKNYAPTCLGCHFAFIMIQYTDRQIRRARSSEIRGVGKGVQGRPSSGGRVARAEGGTDKLRRLLAWFVAQSDSLTVARRLTSTFIEHLSNLERFCLYEFGSQRNTNLVSRIAFPSIVSNCVLLNFYYPTSFAQQSLSIFFTSPRLVSGPNFL